MTMSKQVIFNKVATHLLKQNKRAMRKSYFGDACAYRAADGTKCAIGCLIPDRLYSGRLEGTSVTTWGLKSRLAKYFGFHDSVKRELCDDLQFVHDVDDVAAWRVKLRLVAKEFGLSTACMKSPVKARKAKRKARL